MTSDIRNICAAYASMYNSDLKNQLQEGRDGFSDMDISLLTNVQIQDIVEEVVEEMFNAGNGFVDIEVQMEDMFDHARTAFDKSIKRSEKIDRIESAFTKVMESISSKANRTMVETFMNYRQTKKYQESQTHRLGISLKESNASYGRSISGSKSSVKSKITEMMKSSAERITSGDSNVAQELD